MRHFAILLCAFLVACATPETAPEAFYEGVYAPSNVEIGDDGTFMAMATVLSGKNAPIARKAAFAKLELAAQDGGYGYFVVSGEDEARGLGVRVTVTGQLFEEAASDAPVYPLNAIARLIQGLPIRTLQEIAGERRRNEAAQASRVSQRGADSGNTSASRSARPVERVPAPRPASEPLPNAEEPLVIMAPEDITGSIRKSVAPTPGMLEPLPFKSSVDEGATRLYPQVAPVMPSTGVPSPVAPAAVLNGTPDALQTVPTGVVTR